jgi:HSP20 family molecular chaperone IbpA
MSEMEPLKEGQEVFLKRPIQIYAKVIGVREVDLGWPGGQVQYAVQLLPLEQSYPLEDLEIANRPQTVEAPVEASIPTQPPEQSAAAEPPPQPSEEKRSPSLPGAATRVDEAAPIVSTAPIVSAGDPFFDLAQEINSMITVRAYELYLSRGSEDGHDTEDWLRATSEILLTIPVEIIESDTQLTIRALVPGFTEDQIEVRVAPRAVCITGKQEEVVESLGIEQTEGLSAPAERRASRIFCVTDLPSEVDPVKVDALLGDGVLEVKLQKVGARKVVPIRAKAAFA